MHCFWVGWQPGWKRPAFLVVIGAQDAAEVGVIRGITVSFASGEKIAKRSVAGGGCSEEV